MNKLDANVKNLLNGAGIWIMSTKGETPNAVVIAFKKVADDDTLILFDVFMKTSIENIDENSLIAITVYNGDTMEGYQLKGTATYSTDAKLVAEGNAITNNFKLTTKGAVIVTVNETIVLTPGPDNGKTIN